MRGFTSAIGAALLRVVPPDHWVPKAPQPDITNETAAIGATLAPGSRGATAQLIMFTLP